MLTHVFAAFVAFPVRVPCPMLWVAAVGRYLYIGVSEAVTAATELGEHINVNSTTCFELRVLSGLASRRMIIGRNCAGPSFERLSFERCRNIKRQSDRRQSRTSWKLNHIFIYLGQLVLRLLPARNHASCGWVTFRKDWPRHSLHVYFTCSYHVHASLSFSTDFIHT